MAKLTVSLAGVDYDRTRALFETLSGMLDSGHIDGLISALAPVEQGIIDRQLSVEELFAPSTLSLSKV